MFNPKGNSLLDEQLAVSGLEMSVEPMTAIAAVSATTAIASGISGFFGARSANKKGERDQKVARKRAKKAAEKANKHNNKLDAADKENYYAMREYSRDTSIKNWNRGKQIQDYKFAQSMRAFTKDSKLSGKQLDLNKSAFQQGKAAEKQSIKDMFLDQQFKSETALSTLKQTYAEQSLNKKEQYVQLQGIRSQRNLGTAAIQNNVDQLMTQGSLAKESAMVEGLMAEGESSLGQAGKSRQKTKQSSRANIQRGIISLSSELTGKRQAAGIELAQLNAESSLAETGVGLNLQKINDAIAGAEEEADYNSRVMSANMNSFLKQSKLNLEELALRRQASDLNVKASRMLKPRKLAYDPKPEMPPERIFIERMKVRAGATPSYSKQNEFAPLLAGFGNAASSLASIDFSGGGPKPRIPLNAN